MITNCEVCQRHQRANQREPLLNRELPARPWEKVAVDFYHNGMTYLLLVDYYSKYVEAKKMPTTSASSVITVLKDIYARFGIPSEVVSDQAARQLNRPASPFTEVELPTAHPVTPAEDDGEAHIRILVPAVQYVLEYLAQFHLALELCTTAANPPRSVLRRQ
ncbi:hypothetical protein MRX96_043002 [Rhipicephalus microplus]